MLSMLSGVSIVCFASSYAVALALEFSRLLFRLSVRWFVMIFFAAAGLFAHSVYLVVLTQRELAGAGQVPLASWYDWCLVAAWVLAATYLGLAIRRPRNTVGIFLLPLVLALVGIARSVRDIPPFAREQAASYWSILHSLALMIGTVTAALGFAAGLMYLVQAYRLKHKIPPRQGFRLPTLEWLQRFNSRCLVFSTALLALGLLAGVGLNVVRHSTGGRTLQWNDPVALFSAVLLVWLVGATALEWFYRPARQGRKMAYLTLANFGFLVLALAFVLVGGHGSSSLPPPSKPQVDKVRRVGQQMAPIETLPTTKAATGFLSTIGGGL